MTAHLVRLPESSIRRIFQFLEDSELYEFSMTCIQMHKLALSMLLSRRGIPNPLEKVDIRFGDTSNTLRVLRIALFLPKIKHLSLRFSPGIQPWMTVAPFPPLTLAQLQATADCLLGEMRRIQRLFAKLESVDEITLILPGSLEWNLRDMNLERGDTSDIFSWSAVISFLHQTVENHCTSLRVENSVFRTQARTLPDKATRRYLSRRLLGKAFKCNQEADMTALARWDGVKYRPLTEPHVATRSNIRHFYIQTTFLLFPGAAGWTFSILKNSPLVSLHLSGLSISRWDWAPIASKFIEAVPNLLEFDLDDPRIDPNCLMEMLRSFSRLTSLRLGPRMSVYLRYPHLFSPFSNCYLPAFRNLVKLSAPSSYVSLFLMRRNPFPALTSLEIPPVDIFYIAAYQHKAAYIHVPKIIHRLRDINHVLAPLPVTFSLGLGGVGETSLFWHIHTSLALNSKTADNLREITHVVLSEGFYPSIDVRLLCRWLKLFPALQQVSWDNSPTEWAEALNIPRLAREISRACPTMQTIVADGVQHRISTVLASMQAAEASDAVGSKFIDLPSELLLMMFDFLHDELFSLSILCRRLHFLALPIFLEKNSIANPCETTLVDIGVIDSQDTILLALTVALFVPSIKHLNCVFPAAYTYQCVERIRRVTRLVRRLTSVGHLSLEFVPNKYRPGAWRRDVYTKNRMWQTSYSALRDLLNSVTGKSCTSLTIVGSPVPVACTAAPPLPPPYIGCVTTVSLDVDRSPPHSTPYSSWIFSALKSSPIASLKITVTDNMKLEDEVDFSATLTTLSMDGEHAPRSKVSNYIGRHPLLKTLTLGNDLSNSAYIDAGSLDAPPPRLDNLVELTASVSYLSHFLNTCDPFPALERLTILLADHKDIGWTLASLIERVQECYLQPPTITVKFTGTLDADSLTHSIKFISFMGGKWTHAARQIIGLTVECHLAWFNLAETGSIINPAVAQLLLNWFRLFKSLRNISIVGVDETETVAALVAFADSIGCAFVERPHHSIQPARAVRTIDRCAFGVRGFLVSVFEPT